MEQKKKILIVEDEASMLNALKLKLEKEDVEVLIAKNGEDGLKIALMEKPDLIILDIIMPKMDGIEMLKELKKDEWGENANVIILSNFNDNQKIADVMEESVYQYLIKSDWKIEDIISKIKEELNK